MYRLGFKRDFITAHYLIGGDWGEENSNHSHHYEMELILSGTKLDKHGYLVDLLDVEAAIDAVTAQFANKCLNDLPDFAGINPSLEHFCRILCGRIAEKMNSSEILSRIEVVLWENKQAWASWSQPEGC